MTARKLGLFLVVTLLYIAFLTRMNKPVLLDVPKQSFDRTSIFIHPIRTDLEIPRFTGDEFIFGLFDVYDGFYEISYVSKLRVAVDTGFSQYKPRFEFENTLGCLILMQKFKYGERIRLAVPEHYDVTNRTTSEDRFNLLAMSIWSTQEREEVFNYFSGLVGTDRYRFDITFAKESIENQRPIILELNSNYWILLYGFDEGTNIFYVYDPQYTDNQGATLYANEDGSFQYWTRFLYYTEGVVVNV